MKSPYNPHILPRSVEVEPMAAMMGHQDHQDHLRRRPKAEIEENGALSILQLLAFFSENHGKQKL